MTSYSKTTVQTHVITVWHSTFYCHYDRLDTSAIQLSYNTVAGCWVI